MRNLKNLGKRERNQVVEEIKIGERRRVHVIVTRRMILKGYKKVLGRKVNGILLRKIAPQILNMKVEVQIEKQ